MAEAASTGRTFGLSVEKDNPRAQALYERLGLVVVGEDGDEYVMRLLPLVERRPLRLSRDP